MEQLKFKDRHATHVMFDIDELIDRWMDVFQNRLRSNSFFFDHHESKRSSTLGHTLEYTHDYNGTTE